MSAADGVTPRRVVGALVPFLLVLGVLVYMLQQFVDVEEVWTAIRSMTWLEVVTLLIAAAVNLATYGWLMVCTTPGLTFRQAMVVTEASTAVANTVPGGGALGVAVTVGMLRSWGFSSSRTTVSMLVSGVWNNFAKLALPVLALACLALDGDITRGRVTAALAGVFGLLLAVVALAGLLRSEASARAIGLGAARAAGALRGLVGKGPVAGWDRATVKFRARTSMLLSARWAWLTAVTIASHLALFVVLLLALRHTGVSQEEVSWAEALAVFAFARLLTAVPITPGGVGVVEVALIAGLTRAGGADEQVVAAVLAFRTLTYLLPVPLGVLCYVFWRRNTSWRRAAGQAPRTELVPEAV
jgi:uncharacterized protein (TIRG00374 family)